MLTTRRFHGFDGPDRVRGPRPLLQDFGGKAFGFVLCSPP
jgi:hypothetical protein